MKTLFAVRNSTGETWPAFGMARLGAILDHDGRNADLPLYTLLKPDGAVGIYVVNGASALATTKDGTANHYLDAQRVAVASVAVIAIDDNLGAVAGQWEAGNGGHFLAVDAKNARNIVAVVLLRGYPIWAVNIGSLAPATHPLTGHSTGVAGLFRTNSSGNLETTNGRKSFIRRDMSGTIADGTLIQLDYVSGRLTIVWADCSSHVSIEAQVTAP